MSFILYSLPGYKTMHLPWWLSQIVLKVAIVYCYIFTWRRILLMPITSKSGTISLPMIKDGATLPLLFVLPPPHVNKLTPPLQLPRHHPHLYSHIQLHKPPPDLAR
ncbi:hypothetical protein ACJMK2_026149 [Sinanodonta woodiana]|uniref:Uncharacterized protein n=1 Tax=Sinanodonta woodiana TaxID=1069815 RepID=A0ABD3XM87_SINWO